MEGKCIASYPIRALVLDIEQGKGRRGKVLPNKTGRESPKLGIQVQDLKENPVLMLPLSLTLTRPLASIAMTRGIGNEAARNTCMISRMER